MARGMIAIYKSCKLCGKTHSCTVYKDELKMFRKGILIQYAFPNLTAAQRELFFISGICGKCFNKLFENE